ncbi:DUF2442 domain-containing protein [Rubrivirga sp.]|uniref:DUF2442 domain-containing protein n=1 Tax=Rubrivirga sp. TaxID=1885344 RepID=UPI003B523522
MPGTPDLAPAPPEAAPTLEIAFAHAVGSGVAVGFTDGRVVIVPPDWHPRLAYATAEERAEIETDPLGLHWPALNLDLSPMGVLREGPITESETTLCDWRALMDRRRAQIAAGEEPEPHYPTLPLPDWWDEEDGAESA